MPSKYIVLCTFIFAQEAWCAPPISVSYGTQLSNQFNKNLGLILGNLHKGTSSMVSGPIKFGVDTVPSIVSSGTKKAAEKVSILADANQEAFGKIATGLGHTLGAGGVFASSLAGGAMQVAGEGLGAVNGLVESGAKTGINIAGKLADTTASGTLLGSNVANTALTAAGDGFTVAGSSVSVLSNAISNLINRIEGRLKFSVSSAENMTNKLLDYSSQNFEKIIQNATSSGQLTFYKILNALIQLLDNVEILFAKTSTKIAGSAALSSDTSTVSSDSAAVSSDSAAVSSDSAAVSSDSTAVSSDSAASGSNSGTTTETAAPASGTVPSNTASSDTTT